MGSGGRGFGMEVSPQVEEYLWEIAEEMAERFGIRGGGCGAYRL
ncbi:hypothetical protein SRIMM317S_04640 [Streptomyces rimosus subsp. rimosus]